MSVEMQTRQIEVLAVIPSSTVPEAAGATATAGTFGEEFFAELGDHPEVDELSPLATDTNGGLTGKDFGGQEVELNPTDRVEQLLPVSSVKDGYEGEDASRQEAA